MDHLGNTSSRSWGTRNWGGYQQHNQGWSNSFNFNSYYNRGFSRRPVYASPCFTPAWYCAPWFSDPGYMQTYTTLLRQYLGLPPLANDAPTENDPQPANDQQPAAPPPTAAPNKVEAASVANPATTAQAPAKTEDAPAAADETAKKPIVMPPPPAPPAPKEIKLKDNIEDTAVIDAAAKFKAVKELNKDASANDIFNALTPEEQNAIKVGGAQRIVGMRKPDDTILAAVSECVKICTDLGMDVAAMRGNPEYGYISKPKKK